jgi:hypothetical protein
MQDGTKQTALNILEPPNIGEIYFNGLSQNFILKVYLKVIIKQPITSLL